MIMKNPLFIFEGVSSVNDVLSHTKVHSEPVALEEDRVDFLETLLSRFNDYETNPLSGGNNKEKQKWITDNKLHTSMSVGDAVSFDFDDGSKELWAVQPNGWKKIQ
jgi:hypothetical protein